MTRRDALLFARAMETVSDVEMDRCDVEKGEDNEGLGGDSGKRDVEMNGSADRDVEMNGSEGGNSMEMEDVLMAPSVSSSSTLPPPPPPPPVSNPSPPPPPPVHQSCSPSTLPPGSVDKEHDWWIDRLLEVTTSSAFAWRGTAKMQITPQVLHLVAFYFIQLFSYLTEEEAGQII
jgi:hypothetical protein